MEKNIIVIFGKNRSGKSFLMQQIKLGHFNPVYINLRRKLNIESPFIYSEVTPETDIITVDEISFDNFKTHVFAFFYKKMVIEKQCNPRFTINTPKIVLIIDDEINESDILKLDESILHRCKFIETFISSQENGFPIFMTKVLNLKIS